MFVRTFSMDGFFTGCSGVYCIDWFKVYEVFVVCKYIF